MRAAEFLFFFLCSPVIKVKAARLLIRLWLNVSWEGKLLIYSGLKDLDLVFVILNHVLLVDHYLLVVLNYRRVVPCLSFGFIMDLFNLGVLFSELIL